MVKIENNSQTTSSFLIKLFKGDIRLVSTFWIFGCLVPFLLKFAILISEKYIIKNTYPEFSIFSLKFFPWFMFGYILFISIAIWKSAGKYTGNPEWKILARLVVCINIYFAFYCFGYRR